MKKISSDDLEMVYLAYAEPLYYFLLKLSGSATVAEDLVQETFYRATLSLELYHGGQVKSWLFTVARHAYMDEWRKKQRFKWVPFHEYLFNQSDIESPYGVPEDELNASEIISDVNDILMLLPESYRSILYLREYERFSYKELAATLELSESQVKVNLHRARQRFKQLSERMGKNFERGTNNGME